MHLTTTPQQQQPASSAAAAVVNGPGGGGGDHFSPCISSSSNSSAHSHSSSSNSASTCSRTGSANLSMSTRSRSSNTMNSSSSSTPTPVQFCASPPLDVYRPTRQSQQSPPSKMFHLEGIRNVKSGMKNLQLKLITFLMHDIIVFSVLGGTTNDHLDMISSAADEEIRLQFSTVNPPGPAGERPPVMRDTPSPSKRHRSRTPRPHNIQRPCLDFEKMQQVKYRTLKGHPHASIMYQVSGQNSRPNIFLPSSRFAVVYQSFCSHSTSDRLYYEWIVEKNVDRFLAVLSKNYVWLREFPDKSLNFGLLYDPL